MWSSLHSTRRPSRRSAAGTQRSCSASDKNGHGGGHRARASGQVAWQDAADLLPYPPPDSGNRYRASTLVASRVVDTASDTCVTAAEIDVTFVEIVFTADAALGMF